MDIFEIMDKYIELDILDKKLKERIKSNSEWHDKASSEEKVLLQLGHYDEASIYTDSVRISSENIRAAQESYQEVKSALFEIDKLYKDTVAALSIDDLNDVIAKMVEKREQLKSSENDLKTDCSTLKGKALAARDSQQVYVEMDYWKQHEDASRKLEEVQDKYIIYGGFISYLKNNLNAKLEEQANNSMSSTIQTQNDDRTVFDQVADTTVVYKPSYDTDEFGIVHKPIYSSSDGGIVYKDNDELNSMFDSRDLNSSIESSVVLK